MEISAGTICLVALLRRGLLRAPFPVAILSPRADSGRHISRGRSFRECSASFLSGRDFAFFMRETLHHRRRYHCNSIASLCLSHFPKSILFSFCTFVCSSLVDYHSRPSLRRRQLASAAARECFCNLNRRGTCPSRRNRAIWRDMRVCSSRRDKYEHEDAEIKPIAE